MFVIFAEFNLMRKLLRLQTGKMPTAEVEKVWHLKMRKFGSALSTSRMALRLGIWLRAIKFFITQFQCLLRRRLASKERTPS